MKNSNICFRTVIMALLMSLSCSLYAQTQFWAGGIHYEVTYGGSYDNGDGNVKVIAANSAGYNGELTIPSIVSVEVTGGYGSCYKKTYLVTEVGEGAFRDCTGLTAIALPGSVKSIGKNAFYGCTNLTDVSLSNGLNTIGASAFGYCTSLTDIELPSSVMSMGSTVFYCCSSLTSVTLSKNVTSLVGTFQGCTSLATVNIPSRVKTLDGTFNGCTALVTVELPKSLTEIGANTFDGCRSLRGIYLPDAVESIGDRAFAGTALTALELPATVSSVGNDAFAGCTGLTSVSVRAATPPTMLNADGFAAETYASALLRVPEVSLASYQSANWWNLFQNITGSAALNTSYDFEVDGIYYLITGPNTVDVTYRDNSYNTYSGTVNVPAAVTRDGVTYNVTGIGNSAFRNCTSLTGVTLPASVKTIGENAFTSCSSMTGIVLPESLTSVGSQAFKACTGLTDLMIPVNVTTIGTEAFADIHVQSLTWNARECWTNGNMNTSSISQVAIGDEVTVLPDRIAYQANISSITLPASLKTIGAEAFYECENLTSLTVPENVTSIGDNAFKSLQLEQLTWNARECWSAGYTNGYYWNNYWNIDSLTIGDEVIVLPNNMMRGSDISSLTIPSSVKYIGAYAFNTCRSLDGNLIIPDNVLIIGERAFSNCSKVDAVIIGLGVTSIGEGAFEGMSFGSLVWNARHCESCGMEQGSYGVNQITIGDEVEVLPYAFAMRSNITSIDIPASVKHIGDYAFDGCYDITDVVIPNTVTSMGKGVFCWSGVTNITLSSALTSIGDDAFSGCSGLTEVTIPDGVTRIGYGAFVACSNLTTLTLSASLDTIGELAFRNCHALKDLHIPASVTSIGRNAFSYCGGLESITVESANRVYDSRDNCNAILLTANDSIILTCKNTTLPGSITEIPDYAFMDNTGLTHIDIPATVTRIGRSAFQGCSALADITIPAAVTNIGESAFRSCTSMRSMVVEEGNTVFDSRDGCNAIIRTADNTLLYGCNTSTIPAGVTTIGKNAFFNCTGLTTISLPEGLTTIGSYAFSNCSGLTSITCPESVTSIGSYAFYRCSGLTSVTLPENLTSIPDDIFGYCTALTSIRIPAKVTAIGSYAFYHCDALQSIALPQSLTSIGYYAFGYCKNLTAVRVPDAVTWISNYAFSYCSSLETVTLGTSLRTVYDDAFWGCTALTAVNSLAVAPPSISYWTFSTSTYNNATLRVPQQSIEAYQAADQWKRFVNVVGIPGSGPGDLNGDGRVSIGDVSSLVDALLGGDLDVLNNPYADINGDGKVTIADVAAIINALLNS